MKINRDQVTKVEKRLTYQVCEMLNRSLTPNKLRELWLEFLIDTTKRLQLLNISPESSISSSVKSEIQQDHIIFGC